MLTVRFLPLFLPGLLILYAVPFEAQERKVARSQDRAKFRIRHSLVHDAQTDLVAWEEGWVLCVVMPVVGLLVLIPVVLVVVVCYLSGT
jgi:hypothetical protein